jgi:hypothetical protein
MEWRRHIIQQFLDELKWNGEFIIQQFLDELPTKKPGLGKDAFPSEFALP